MSDLRKFADSDSCPELIRVRVEALLSFLAERNIDARIDDVASDHVSQRLTLQLTLDFEWRPVSARPVLECADYGN